jgi:hypothetical protein
MIIKQVKGTQSEKKFEAVMPRSYLTEDVLVVISSH